VSRRVSRSFPERLLVLGGGAVGTELSQALGRLGVQVTLIEGASRLMPGEAPALGETLAAALSAEGINVHLGAFVSAVERDGEDYVLQFEDGRQLRGDRLLVATGRRPRTDDLDSRRSGSSPCAAASQLTSSWLPATPCGLSATSPASRSSRMSASIRHASLPPACSVDRSPPTTGRSRASCSPTRRSPPSEPQKAP
jgi:hypothetical protein